LFSLLKSLSCLFLVSFLLVGNSVALDAATQTQLLQDSQASLADIELEVLSEEDGIVVSGRKTENSTLILGQIKLEQTTIPDLIQIMGEVEHYCQWIGKCVEAEKLNVEEFDGVKYRLVLKSPTFYKKRELINIVHKIDESESVVWLVGRTSENETGKKKYVLMPKSDGFWRFEEGADGDVLVSIYFDIDAGGGVPKRAVQWYVHQVAKDTLAGLRDYTNSHISTK